MYPNNLCSLDGCNHLACQALRTREKDAQQRDQVRRRVLPKAGGAEEGSGAVSQALRDQGAATQSTNGVDAGRDAFDSKSMFCPKFHLLQD